MCVCERERERERVSKGKVCGLVLSNVGYIVLHLPVSDFVSGSFLTVDLFEKRI